MDPEARYPADRARRTQALPHAAWIGLCASVLSGCGGTHPLSVSAAAEPVAAVMVQPRRTPIERRLDGVIEAVNQGTVAAQTPGALPSIFYDVNDFVPAGAVIIRLRATEQRAGLAQAEAAFSEASARAAEAQIRYQRIADMYRAQGRAQGDARFGDRGPRCRGGAI